MRKRFSWKLLIVSCQSIIAAPAWTYGSVLQHNRECFTTKLTDSNLYGRLSSEGLARGHLWSQYIPANIYTSNCSEWSLTVTRRSQLRQHRRMAFCVFTRCLNTAQGQVAFLWKATVACQKAQGSRQCPAGRGLPPDVLSVGTVTDLGFVYGREKLCILCYIL